MENNSSKTTARMIFLIISAVFLIYVFYSESINNWWAVLPGVVLASAAWHFASKKN